MGATDGGGIVGIDFETLFPGVIASCMELEIGEGAKFFEPKLEDEFASAALIAYLHERRSKKLGEEAGVISAKQTRDGGMYIFVDEQTPPE